MKKGERARQDITDSDSLTNSNWLNKKINSSYLQGITWQEEEQ